MLCQAELTLIIKDLLKSIIICNLKICIPAFLISWSAQICIPAFLISWSAQFENMYSCFPNFLERSNFTFFLDFFFTIYSDI